MVKKSYKKGISLLEVIIVLAVISLTMVSAMNVVVRANIVVKDNEIQDTANDIMVQAIEALGSPDPVDVDTAGGGFTDLQVINLTSRYQFQYATGTPQKGKLRKRTGALTTCNASSNYMVDPVQGSPPRPYPICMMAEITPRTTNGSTITHYQVHIREVYNTSGQTITEDVTIFRYDRFDPF